MELDPRGAAAWLDLQAGGSGWLVTAAQLEDTRWRERQASALGALGQELRLEEELAAELNQRLESMREGLDNPNREGLLEVEDRIEGRLRQIAERAQERGAQALGEFQAAELRAQAGQSAQAQEAFSAALGELVSAGLGDVVGEAVAQLTEELDMGGRGAASIDPRLLCGLDPGLGQLGAEADSEALRRLLEALAGDPRLAAILGDELAQLLDRKISRLANAGLLEDAVLLSDEQREALRELSDQLAQGLAAGAQGGHVCDQDCPVGGT